MNIQVKALCSLILGLYLISWRADAATCPTPAYCSGTGWGYQYYDTGTYASASLVGGDPNGAVSGYGVEGVVASTNPYSAVYGLSNGNSDAIFGYCSSSTTSTCIGSGGENAGSGPGVYGLSISGNGVYADSINGTAMSAYSTYGVAIEGESVSASDAIYGYNPATAAGGIGVYGYSANGVGVKGLNANGNEDGVEGYSSASGYSGGAFWNNGTGKAVFADSQYGTAGYFQGNVDVAGNLTKTTGSFKIDHPLDPANKYLYHSFVESPDMKNVYDGVATMDTRGETTVQLPNYFEALNRDYRYQLTSIGRFSPVYVAEKVSNNAFKIAGGLPGQEVSWQVTGIRQDAYAAAHPIVPEVDKDSADQGKYLHPQEVAGVPRSSSTAIGWRDPPSLDRPPERDRPERRDGSGIVSVCR
jgi:hypothetical protein